MNGDTKDMGDVFRKEAPYLKDRRPNQQRGDMKRMMDEAYAFATPSDPFQLHHYNF